MEIAIGFQQNFLSQNGDLHRDNEVQIMGQFFLMAATSFGVTTDSDEFPHECRM